MNLFAFGVYLPVGGGLGWFKPNQEGVQLPSSLHQVASPERIITYDTCS